GGEVHRCFLRAPLEDGVIELDLEIHLEAVERIELRPLVAVLDPHAFLHADEPFRRALLLDPGGLQQEYERPGTAVHDRDFHGAQLDDGVVDAESCERRQQVLHGRHACIALAQSRAQGRLADILRTCPDVHRLGQVRPAEYDPAVRLGRSKGHQYLLARMQTDASGADRIFQRSLSNHELLRIVPVLDPPRSVNGRPSVRTKARYRTTRQKQAPTLSEHAACLAESRPFRAGLTGVSTRANYSRLPARSATEA